MGKFGRALKQERSAEKAAGAGKSASNVEKAATSAGNPRDIVRESSQVLDAAGDPDFKEGGKFSKLKNWSQQSMSRRQYNNQFDQSMNNYQMNPGMGAGGLNNLMMQQMNGTMSDMNVAGTIGQRVGGLSMIDKAKDAVNIVKGGIGMVTALAHGDFKGVASSALAMKDAFQHNGMNSMVDSVGKLHNNGMINQVQPQTWNTMGQLDNGSMASRLGFSPSMAASNPSIAATALNSQFQPGAGVPSSFGSPRGGLVSTLVKGGAAVAAGTMLYENRDTIGSALKSLGGDALDLAGGTGNGLVDGAAKALHLDGALKLGTELATGESSSAVDRALSKNSQNEPQVSKDEEGLSK